MSNRNIFLTIYFVGIGLTLFCGILLIYQVPFISPKLLLVLGITHVLGLFFLSVFRNEKSDRKIEDGNFIQTAGYLHTLIGFIVAVGLVGDNISDINNLLSPLSSALITSLLGWWLGGFIASQGEHEQPSLNQDIADAVAREVAKALDKELKQYSQSISNSFDDLNKKSQSLSFTFDTLNTTIISKTKELSTSFDELISNIGKKSRLFSLKFVGITDVLESQKQALSNSFKEINNILDSQQQPLLNSFQGINIVLDSQQQPLLNSFQGINDVLEQQKAPLSRSFQGINNVLDSQQQPLLNSFQGINNVLDSQQQPLLNSFQGINNVLSQQTKLLENNATDWSSSLTLIQTNLDDLSQNTKNASNKMSQTATQANKVTKYLQKTHELWLQLEELTKYIQRVTQ